MQSTCLSHRATRHERGIGFHHSKERGQKRHRKEKEKATKKFFFFLMSHVRIELWTSSSMVLNSTIYTDGLDDSRFEHDHLNSKNMFYRSGVRSPRRASYFPFYFSLCLCSRFLALSFFAFFYSSCIFPSFIYSKC